MKLDGYFNSHPHEEDDENWILWNEGDDISTHILTKRMTAVAICMIQGSKDFNSHPHEEDDTVAQGKCQGVAIFQLTSSRRG